MLWSVVASGQAKPGAQVVHVPLPAMANVPGRQGTRARLDVLVQLYPAGQEVQKLEPVSESEPGGQANCVWWVWAHVSGLR